MPGGIPAVLVLRAQVSAGHSREKVLERVGNHRSRLRAGQQFCGNIPLYSGNRTCGKCVEHATAAAMPNLTISAALCGALLAQPVRPALCRQRRCFDLLATTRADFFMAHSPVLHASESHVDLDFLGTCRRLDPSQHLDLHLVPALLLSWRSMRSWNLLSRSRHTWQRYHPECRPALRPRTPISAFRGSRNSMLVCPPTPRSARPRFSHQEARADLT